MSSIATRLFTLTVLVSPLVLPASSSAQSVADNINTAQNIINVGLSSKDPATRARAIAATGMIAKTQSVRMRIEGFLTDKDVNVRIAAADTLADLGFHESIPALKHVLDTDPVPEVEFAAAKALYRLNDPQGKRTLEDVLYGQLNVKSGYFQRQKRRVLSSFHSVHSASIFLLSTSGGLVPVPGAGLGLSEVARLLDDSTLTPQATVVLLLAREHGPDIDKLLRFSLTDKDATVRSAAVLMIALTARTYMREDLVPLLSDNDARVRFRAAGAYLHLIGAHAAPKQ
ncbi:MAG TPA: HEAT repeat domain-containing protein [Acidobacteriaceae bacterium]|nr:HEAT repeat domain-containing protein [Acidobacteriaceae bacterium]